MSRPLHHVRLKLPTSHKYAYVYRPALAGRPTFLFLHGFPSTRLIWYDVADRLSSDGYGVIIPDLLGYGDSSKPTDMREYSFRKMSSEVVHILMQEELDSVIGVGHDWGSVLLSRMWWSFPGRFSRLAFMAVAYGPPSPLGLDATSKMAKERFGYDMGGYWYFLISQEAPSLLDAHVGSALSLFYQSDAQIWKDSLLPAGKLKEWLIRGIKLALPTYYNSHSAGAEGYNKLLEAFIQGGFEAPIQWFKSALYHIDRDWEAAIPGPDLVIKRPVSFIVGEHDPVGSPEIAFHAGQRGQVHGLLPDVEIDVIKGTGHWMMLEEPEKTAKALAKLAGRV